MQERTWVAVVDDEPIWLATVGRALSREGYHAQLIGDPEAALEMIAADAPTVAILDRRMPGMDGLELARALLVRMGEDCPCLFLVTGDLGELTPSELARFDAVFEKPVPLRELMRAVRRAVRGAKTSGTIEAQPDTAHDAWTRDSDDLADSDVG
ncbi:MAG: response regulator transcription factor [Sandaracinaceae bacterium]